MNYANIAWVSTYTTKLKRVYLIQICALHIVFNKDKLTHSNPFFENLNALKVYQISIYQQLPFMNKFINNQIPLIFSDLIKDLIINRKVLGIEWGKFNDMLTFY